MAISSPLGSRRSSVRSIRRSRSVRIVRRRSRRRETTSPVPSVAAPTARTPTSSPAETSAVPDSTPLGMVFPERTWSTAPMMARTPPSKSPAEKKLRPALAIARPGTSMPAWVTTSVRRSSIATSTRIPFSSTGSPTPHALARFTAKSTGSSPRASAAITTANGFPCVAITRPIASETRSGSSTRFGSSVKSPSQTRPRYSPQSISWAEAMPAMARSATTASIAAPMRTDTRFERPITRLRTAVGCR